MSSKKAKSSTSQRLNLARKYRPHQLKDVVGQDHVIQILQEAFKEDRISPAYLLSGPRGVGKTSTARILAKAAACLSEQSEHKPCNECKSCKAIDNSSNMDIVEIDGASHTGVDDVRQIIEAVAYRPGLSARNIYIIDEVHMLSNAAFNALLKTLEEPPSHALFIFATTEPEKLPATILSRVQRLELRRLTELVIHDQLVKISKLESIAIDEKIISQIAASADGALRDALTLLEQVVLLSGSKEIQPEVVDQFLGTIGTEHEIQLLEMLAERRIDDILESLWQFFEKGKDLSKLSFRLLKWTRCLLVSRNIRKFDLLEIEFPKEFIHRLSAAFKAWSIDDLDRLFEVFYQTNERMKRSDMPRMTLESGFIRASRLVHTEDLNQILSRLQSSRASELLQAPRQEQRIDSPPRQTASRPAPKPTPAQETAPPAPTKPVEKPTDQASFLAAIKATKPGLFGLIRCATKIEVADKSVSLNFPAKHFALRQLEDASLKNELHQALTEIFGSKIKLELSGEGEDPHKNQIENKDFIKESKKAALENQDVMDAVKNLGGKVEDVTIEGIRT